MSRTPLHKTKTEAKLTPVHSLKANFLTNKRIAANFLTNKQQQIWFQVSNFLGTGTLYLWDFFPLNPPIEMFKLQYEEASFPNVKKLYLAGLRDSFCLISSSDQKETYREE